MKFDKSPSFSKSYKMKARAGLSLPILTTVEVEIELHLCQQILNRVKFQQKKDSLGFAKIMLTQVSTKLKLKLKLKLSFKF